MWGTVIEVEQSNVTTIKVRIGDVGHTPQWLETDVQLYQATSARTATETAGRQSDALPFKHSFLSEQTCKLSPRKAK
jgi:hypothetical protein